MNTADAQHDRSDCSSHCSPYRITDQDRYGTPVPAWDPHSCSTCAPITVLVGPRATYTHAFPMSAFIAALPNAEGAASQASGPGPCRFIEWCMHTLDIQWGRPKSGEPLLSRILKVPGRLEGMKLVVKTSATATIGPTVSGDRGRDKGASQEKVIISFALEGASELARKVTQTFKVLAREDEPAAVHFASRPVRPVMQSLAGQLQNAIASRMKTYERTIRMTNTDRAPPTRLVDLGPDPQQISPRLVMTVPGWRENYLCLSYCWGGDQPLKSTTENITSLSSFSGFPYQNLPRTLQDACLVTKLLGQRYIWIDALCIVQDDPTDKVREIPRMREIYRGALLTITASRTSSASEGFLQDRVGGLIKGNCAFAFKFGVPEKPPQPQATSATASAPNNNSELYDTKTQANLEGFVLQGLVSIFLPTFDLSDDPPREPLQTRAWAFQERLLSSRVLDFSSFQTSLQDEMTGSGLLTDGGWITNVTTTKSLGSLSGIIRHTTIITPGTEALVKTATVASDLGIYHPGYQNEVWAMVVREYTKLDLTVPSDKLVAFEGLAEWFGLWLSALGTQASSSPPMETLLPADTQTRYLAGIWSHHLPASLMWHVSAKHNHAFSSLGTVSGQQDGFGILAQPTVSLPPRRPKTWRAPSWTWTCIDTSVEIPHQLDARPDRQNWRIGEITASVLDTNVIMTVETDSYGPVSSGHLILEAPMFPVVCQRNWDETSGSIWAIDGLSGASFGSAVFDARSVDDEARLCNLDEQTGLSSMVAPGKNRGTAPLFRAWCLQILVRPARGITLNNPDPRITENLGGLLILPVPDQDETTYTRIGIFETELRAAKPHVSFEAIETWKAGFKRRRIKLI